MASGMESMSLLTLMPSPITASGGDRSAVTLVSIKMQGVSDVSVASQKSEGQRELDVEAREAKRRQVQAYFRAKYNHK